ncbi:hypothetical protein [Paenisporosarcina antarctica]|uniref:Uncharacterized protein n=1 Tax=Paenisporosarcina antarctica TaxID=417367 RepID=A0A4P6ZWH6_9BACL|nr:hypothetical protein [Paenisporosarcina antarctica]QBP40761.1 hypothetical protein E2636_06340 [Paenisporosarcina antarctica]
MKQIINQRGYALLIVLFTIIIFLSITALFMKGSLNHVAQERTVNLNNQATVAAEMGVKFFSIDISNNIKGILATLKKELSSQEECKKNNSCICPNIQQKKLSIENLTDVINDCLQSELNKLIVRKSDAYIDGEYILKTENKNLNFNLIQEIEINPSDENEEKKGHNLILHVNGESFEENTALLTAKIFVSNFQPSDITSEVKNVSNESNKLDNTKIFQSIPSKLCSSLIQNDVNNSAGLFNCKLSVGEEASELVSNLGDKNINLADLSIYAESIESFCGNGKGKGKCNSSNLDILGEAMVYMQHVSVGNFNQAGGFNLIVNGKLTLGNANNLGDYNKKTYILVKEFDGKNQFDLINGTMIFTGSDNTSSVFDLKQSFNLVNSTACFNLAKFENNTISLDNIKSIKGTGKLIVLNTTNSSKFKKDDINAPGIDVSIPTDPNEFAELCDFNKFGFNTKYTIESLSIDYVDNVIYN